MKPTTKHSLMLFAHTFFSALAIVVFCTGLAVVLLT
jgi:hypothetical protein